MLTRLRADHRGPTHGYQVVSPGPVAGYGLEAVKTFVERTDQAGPVLNAAQSALVRCGQAALCFGEDDLGQGPGTGVVVQEIGVTPDVGGDGAGVAGELQGDLFVVVRGEGGGVGPGQDGGDETFVGARSRDRSAPKNPCGSWRTVWVFGFISPRRRGRAVVTSGDQEVTS
ncbi:hypothetical protein ACVWXU_000332 [Streptomyces sp. TE33382]